MTACLICKKCNHWARACTSKRRDDGKNSFWPQYSRTKIQPLSRHNKEIYTIENNSDTEDRSVDSPGSHAVNTRDNHTKVTAKVNFKIAVKELISAKLSVNMNTGAEENILPLKIFKQMHPKQPERVIKQSTVISTAYNRTTIQYIGILRLKYRYNRGTHGHLWWCNG